MDYGNTQKFNLDDFNLDTEEFNATPERGVQDQRNLGNKAINGPASPETPQPGTFPGAEAGIPELGQITPSMPPGYEQPTTVPSEPMAEAPSAPENPFIHLSRKAKSQDKFTMHDVKIVDSVIQELNQTGDIANFYDEVRNAIGEAK